MTMRAQRREPLVDRLLDDRARVDLVPDERLAPVARLLVERFAVAERRVDVLREEVPLRGDLPLVAAFCSFSRSRVTVRLMVVRFLRESFSARSKSLTMVLPPRPSSLRRSFSAISAASSDFSSRPIAFGPTTFRPLLFAAAVTRLLVEVFRAAMTSLLSSVVEPRPGIIAGSAATC